MQSLVVSLIIGNDGGLCIRAVMCDIKENNLLKRKKMNNGCEWYFMNLLKGQ